VSGNVVFVLVLAVCRPTTELAMTAGEKLRLSCMLHVLNNHDSLLTRQETDCTHLRAYSGVIVALLGRAA